MSSLATDSLFIAALAANDNLMQRISGRLYSTAIPLPDEDADNVPCPYVIVAFNGLTNEQPTKDDPMEGKADTVQIGIEVTANNREELAQLTQEVRDTIHDYFTADVDDDRNDMQWYQFIAERITYDSEKPCYWQVLNYECNVINQ